MDILDHIASLDWNDRAVAQAYDWFSEPFRRLDKHGHIEEPVDAPHMYAYAILGSKANGSIDSRWFLPQPREPRVWVQRFPSHSKEPRFRLLRFFGESTEPRPKSGSGTEFCGTVFCAHAVRHGKRVEMPTKRCEAIDIVSLVVM